MNTKLGRGRLLEGSKERLTVGLEIFDGHKLGGTGVTLGNGFCKGEEDVFSDRWQYSASLCRYRVVRVSDEDV